MKLSFVIPAYNEEHYIGDCLDAILREKRTLVATPAGAARASEIEIIVVNNASTDGTATVVKKYIADDAGRDGNGAGIKLVTENQKGLVRARQAGYLASTGELIANVDSDARILPGWIERVLDEFARDPKLVALSGPFIYYDAPRKVRISTRAFYYIGYFFYLINRFVFHVGSMLQGGNFVVRRSALEKIGGYNLDISFYGEDTDIARRMSKVGKVKFTFTLPVNASGRRLAKEGGLTTGLRYAVNFFWTTFFGRPWTQDYSDIRLQNKNSVVYAPMDRTKEWIIGIGFVIVVLVILGALGGGAYFAWLSFVTKP